MTKTSGGKLFIKSLVKNYLVALRAETTVFKLYQPYLSIEIL
jgi:hypothetical protein